MVPELMNRNHRRVRTKWLNLCLAIYLGAAILADLLEAPTWLGRTIIIGGVIVAVVTAQLLTRREDERHQRQGRSGEERV